MNSRKLYREYLKSTGCDCKEFISLKDDWYSAQIITYKDSDGVLHTSNICVKAMMLWIFNSFNNDIWKGYRGE